MRDVKINKRRRWELTPPPSPFINQPATLLLDATCYQSSPSLPGGGREEGRGWRGGTCQAAVRHRSGKKNK